MSFPHIKHLNDLLPYIAGNPQIRVKKDEDTGHTVVCYMVQDEDTFDGENPEFARECRGITFDSLGEISSRTMHKFFGVGQRPDTMPDVVMWGDVVRVMEKRDGSMITPVRLSQPGLRHDSLPGWTFKTKKSFTTREAECAGAVSARTPGGDLWVAQMLKRGLTPTFEITSPRFPIVVRYEKDELTLLHVRENVTGKYLSEDEIRALNPPFPIVENIVHKFCGDGVPKNLVSWDKLREYHETATEVEGVVLQFKNGDMLKLKTKWYMDLHHAVTFIRWRDIARAVVADQSDDLKASFTLCGRDLFPIIRVENKIKERIDHVAARAWTQVEDARSRGDDAKALALRLKGHELFGQIMRMYRGQDVNWMEFYEKHYLDADWSLEVAPV